MFYVPTLFSKVLEGYGSTETGGIVCTSLIGDTTAGHVGALGVGVIVKLADVPDMGFVVERDRMGEVCKTPRVTVTFIFPN